MPVKTWPVTMIILLEFRSLNVLTRTCINVCIVAEDNSENFPTRSYGQVLQIIHCTHNHPRSCHNHSRSNNTQTCVAKVPYYYHTANVSKMFTSITQLIYVCLFYLDSEKLSVTIVT